jgi:rod shape-determining protein MreD
MLMQVLILNDIVIRSSVTLFGFPAFTPMLYPLFLLILPVNIPTWLFMIIGMGTGFVIDTFSNTPGMHAAACVLLCFIRPHLLRLFFQQSAKELGDIEPSLFRMGIASFLIYVAVSIIIHHFFFYLLQIWSFRNILLIIFKTFLSGVMSVILILLSQLLFATRDIRRT